MHSQHILTADPVAEPENNDLSETTELSRIKLNGADTTVIKTMKRYDKCPGYK